MGTQRIHEAGQEQGSPLLLLSNEIPSCQKNIDKLEGFQRKKTRKGAEELNAV